MEASSAETKTLLDQILKRLDESMVVGNKRHEDQVTFNTTVTQDLRALRHQIDLTQADVDEARQAATIGVQVVPTQAQPPPAAGVDHRAAAAAFVASGLGVPGYPRLANDGAPLLPQTQEPPLLRPQPVRHNIDVHPQHGQETENGYVKPPKHDFPRFDGTLPNLWLDRCAAYFEMYGVLPHNWVTTASLYVEGHAALWLQAFRQLHDQISWPRFKQAIVEEFGPDEYEIQMSQLLQLRQTGSVAEY